MFAAWIPRIYRKAQRMSTHTAADVTSVLVHGSARRQLQSEAAGCSAARLGKGGVAGMQQRAPLAALRVLRGAAQKLLVAAAQPRARHQLLRACGSAGHSLGARAQERASISRAAYNHSPPMHNHLITAGRGCTLLMQLEGGPGTIAAQDQAPSSGPSTWLWARCRTPSTLADVYRAMRRGWQSRAPRLQAREQRQQRVARLHGPEAAQQVAGVGLLAQVEHHKRRAHLSARARSPSTDACTHRSVAQHTH